MEALLLVAKHAVDADAEVLTDSCAAAIAANDVEQVFLGQFDLASRMLWEQSQLFGAKGLTIFAVFPCADSIHLGSPFVMQNMTHRLISNCSQDGKSSVSMATTTLLWLSLLRS